MTLFFCFFSKFNIKFYDKLVRYNILETYANRMKLYDSNVTTNHSYEGHDLLKSSTEYKYSRKIYLPRNKCSFCLFETFEN